MGNSTPARGGTRTDSIRQIADLALPDTDDQTQPPLDDHDLAGLAADEAARCVKSATRVRFGAGATKSWSTRSEGRCGSVSGIVVRTLAADGSGDAGLAHEAFDGAGNFMLVPGRGFVQPMRNSPPQTVVAGALGILRQSVQTPSMPSAGWRSASR
ncbi:hypothetical protein OG749_08640 [Streptomyces nojiriensis]|uniref:hypothetical protein n=1 Tax=Streptomyces nojiriensis TaxID=66374 RepID=UPI002E19DEFC